MTTLCPTQPQVENLTDFQARWCQNTNFLFAPGIIDFDYEFPRIPELLTGLLSSDDTTATAGKISKTRDRQTILEQFRETPHEEILNGTFQLSHYKLEQFYDKGSILHGFKEKVLDPWKRFLHNNGFTWTRCFPIIRLSGKKSVTGYHFDNSNVLFWQVYGTKTFYGLQEPERFAPAEVFVARDEKLNAAMPETLQKEDVLSLDIGPGDKLWNAFMTPHWVTSGDEVSFGVNISMGDLRYKGQLCRNEELLFAHWDANPNEDVRHWNIDPEGRGGRGPFLEGKTE